MEVTALVFYSVKMETHDIATSSYQALSPCSPTNPLAGQKHIGIPTEELSTTLTGKTKRPRYIFGESLCPSALANSAYLLSEEGKRDWRSAATPLPQVIDSWLCKFLSWTPEQKTKALDAIISACDSSQLKFMLEKIRPQFQRDFISLLPKELALHVLSFLEPQDLLVAAQICRTWNALCEDNLLWKAKCKRYDIDESILRSSCRRPSGAVISNPWKQVYLHSFFDADRYHSMIVVTLL
jgi:hypothetical protein